MKATRKGDQLSRLIDDKYYEGRDEKEGQQQQSSTDGSSHDGSRLTDVTYSP